MRLRASFVVENSVIIPLFTLIIVVLILFSFDLHDRGIMDSAMIQGDLKVEQEFREEAQSGYKSLASDIESYVDGKSIRLNAEYDEVLKKYKEIKVERWMSN